MSTENSSLLTKAASILKLQSRFDLISIKKDVAVTCADYDGAAELKKEAEKLNSEIEELRKTTITLEELELLMSFLRIILGKMKRGTVASILNEPQFEELKQLDAILFSFSDLPITK